MEILYQIVPLSIFLLVLIFLSGWFSSTETALTNLGPVKIAKMKKKGVKNVDYVYKLKQNMNRTLIAILIFNNIVNVLLSAISAVVAESLFQTAGVSIAVGVITFIIIIFGDITPKSLAIKETEKIVSKNSRIIYYLMKGISPLITFFIVLSRWILKMVGVSASPSKLIVTDDSIRDLATLGEEEGVIKEIERDIIHKVFQFGDVTIKEVMVPIKDVYTLKEGMTYEEAKELISTRGFTRVPVVDKDNQIVGILYSKDLLGGSVDKLKELYRKPLFISMGKHVTSVFQQMQKKRIHMAIIKNRNGKHIGIATLEDILEELVGEIDDEYFKAQYRLKK
jgi:putative hemolysin